jgi:phage terminase small subunit
VAKVPTQESIKRKTIRDMKELGVHKPQFNRLIDIYAGLVHQYLIALKEFEASGYVYEVETAAGGLKKSPIVATLETLRKDILQYSDRLCLNPTAFKSAKVDDSERKSTLASVLSALEG